MPVYISDFLMVADGDGIIRYIDEAIDHWDSMGVQNLRPQAS